MTPASLRTERLAIGYPGRIIARDLSLELRAEEMTCVLGANGVGKSTLLRTLAGLQRPLEGTVWCDGERLGDLDPRELARRRSVVLADRPAPGLLTVMDLVTLGRLPYAGWTGGMSPRDHIAVHDALQRVGLLPLARRPLPRLSDGERQKAYLARALAQAARIIILDEPTAFLDMPRRAEILRLLRDTARTQQGIVLLSTHDLELAFRLADRLWFLDESGNVTVGPPEELALSGRLDAFLGESLLMDHSSGTIRLVKNTVGRAFIDGTGPRAWWTRRALERLDYCVVDSEAPGERDVDVIVEDHCWRWIQQDRPLELGSLAEVIEHARRHIASKGAAR